VFTYCLFFVAGVAIILVVKHACPVFFFKAKQESRHYICFKITMSPLSNDQRMCMASGSRQNYA
jgi:hypothetical protein